MKTKRIVGLCLAGVAVEALLSVASPATAQTSTVASDAAAPTDATPTTAAAPALAPSAPSSQPAVQNSSSLGDIVVTANKREQKLQDVGLTINAVTGAQLKDQHVTDLADLVRTVPNLSLQPTAFSTPVYTIRGIGFYDSSLSSYPAVATYIDEVPLPFPSLTTHTAFDLAGRGNSGRRCWS